MWTERPCGHDVDYDDTGEAREPHDEPKRAEKHQGTHHKVKSICLTASAPADIDLPGFILSKKLLLPEKT